MNEENTRRFMSQEARKGNGASVGIPPRLMKFPLPEGKTKYPFYNGNPTCNALFAVFSAIFPPGERFFVESARRFRDQISDSRLKAQVSGFIGQEAIHGREHERLNEWFAANGFDIAMADRMIRFSLGLLERLSPQQQLACTSYMEHFTAHLAEQWLTNTEFRSSSDADMLQLWSWHAVEELEHKSVVFDVHEQVSATAYRERLLAMAYVAVLLLPSVLFSWAWITARQGELFNVRAHRQAARALFGRKGFLSGVLVHVPAFAARRFHPSQQRTEALEQQWRSRLFGEQGDLNGFFTNRAAVEQAMPAA